MCMQYAICNMLICIQMNQTIKTHYWKVWEDIEPWKQRNQSVVHKLDPPLFLGYVWWSRSHQRHVVYKYVNQKPLTERLHMWTRIENESFRERSTRKWDSTALLIYHFIFSYFPPNQTILKPKTLTNIAR